MTGILNRKGDLQLLHPLVRPQFRALNDLLIERYDNGVGLGRILFQPFETYRPPERQQVLYEQGRTMPGQKVTNAKPWQSPHQFGLACDFVPRRRKDANFVNSDWVWDWDAATDEDWSFLATSAASVGLSCPIIWDRPHVEARDVWEDWKTILDYHQNRQ